METGITIDEWLRNRVCDIKAQIGALEELNVIFHNDAERLVRHDQAEYFNSIKNRILKEVQWVQRMETASQSGRSQGAIISGIAAFGLGSLFAAMGGSKDPVYTGLNLANAVLSEEIPFGTVLIAIVKKGIPEDLKVISLSRLARESNTSEETIKTALKERGYLLMKPEEFDIVLDKLISNILDGSVSLPINNKDLL